MCLIILSPKGDQLNDDKILNAYLTNQDSWGLAWADGGKLRIVKGFGYDTLIEAYRKVAGLPHMLHFRYATSGKIDQENAHPFQLSEGVAFAHNGVLPVERTNLEMSDTWHYVQLLKPILDEYPEALMNPKFLEAMEESIGQGNKFTFLMSDGRYVIVNEMAGKWIGGIWVSNTYSLEDPWVWAWEAPKASRKGARNRGPRTRRNRRQKPSWGSCEASQATNEDTYVNCCYCGCYRPLGSKEGGVEICAFCEATERAYFGRLSRA